MNATTQEKFEAAVNVIQNLPKDGPYQPTNEMRLKFYSLYKQATVGPCNSNKPAFWDVVGRVKWEAWRKLGDMTKDEAMLAYIEGLKEISLQIVETMAYTDKIAEFMESVGPFYEIVELPMPKKNSYDDDENDGPTSSGLTCFIISKRVGKYKHLEFILRAKANNGNEPYDVGNNSSPDNLINGSWPEQSTIRYQENGHVPMRDVISDRFYSSNESDEEFSDPMDNDLLTDEIAGDSSTETNGTFVHVDTDDIQQNGGKVNVQNGSLSGVTVRGGGDPMSSSSNIRLYGGGTSQRNTSLASGVSGNFLGTSAPLRVPMGAGGGRGHGPQGNAVSGDVTEQIAFALSQLQKDMESVLTRLNTLEALTVAHHNLAQGQLKNNGSGAVSYGHSKSSVPSWWPFKNMPIRAVAFFIAWPVIYHLFVKLISISRARNVKSLRR